MTDAGRHNGFLAAVVLGLSHVGCDSAPAGPSFPSFDVVCPISLFVGQTESCSAFVKGTQTRLGVRWESSDPNIASFVGAGFLRGRSGGQVVVTASFQDKSESASVSVRLEDVVQLRSGQYTGNFRVGDIVTISVGGFYGVASASTGQLSVVVTDQNDAQISASEPRVVARGGDSFLIDHTLTLPVGMTRLCRKVVLQVGAVTLASEGPTSPPPCFNLSR